jgi:hypothetical protein
LRQAVENRFFISFLLAAAAGLTLFFESPFPSTDALLALIRSQHPSIHSALQWTYTVLLFTTPYIVSSSLLSFA